MPTLQVFDFGGRKVRTAGTHEAPLFCAADVCAVLGIDDSARACERLDQDEVEEVAAKEPIPTSARGGRKALYVTESGLFSLILGSRKPEAKSFKKWVTSEVLPAIRRQGYYDFAEQERRRIVEHTLAEIFPRLPGRATPIFRKLIGALLELRGEADSAGNPPWARLLASMVYEWAIPVSGQQAHRRGKNAKPSGARVDYSMLSEDALERVKHVAEHGVTVATLSQSWEAWRANMDIVYGQQRRLPFAKPVLYALPKPKREKEPA